MFNFDLHNHIPIYQQLYRKIIELILKGSLSENDKLPSVRNLSKQLNINPNTVAKAYQELERNNIIYSISGCGSFIAKINENYLKNYLLSDFDFCSIEAIKLGISKDELKSRIDKIYNYDSL